jgi:hypothetical protein
MNNEMRREFGWLWTSGATALLLAVGGLIFQVKSLSSDVAELRDRGSPILKARLDVVESQMITQSKQFESISIEMKLDLKEIRRMLEDHMRKVTP